MSLWSWARRQKRSILAFTAVWWVYGLMINARDLDHYGLYQIGAEAIVDFGTFAVGKTRIPQLQQAGDGDVFQYQGRFFIAKQPGSMVATAIPYLGLKLFGFTYEEDYRFVAAFASWVTAGALAALSVVFLAQFLLSLGHSTAITGVVSTAYAFGTTLFPYTGVPHHDGIASSLLFISVLGLLRLSPASPRGRVILWGALMGMVLFFSMLPALLVAATLVFAFIHLGWRQVFWFYFGFGLGNLPLAIYNAYYFGNPLRQANMAGGYSNTFFAPSLDRFMIRAGEYFSPLNNMSATKNMPVFVLGLAGVFFLNSKIRGFQWLILTMIVLHLGYLFSIGTEGHCQFGPRYLLPLIPFVMIGYAAWFATGPQRLIALAAWVPSLAINTLGAIGDSMQCANLVYFAATHIWKNFAAISSDHRPLLPLLVSIAIGIAAWAAIHAVWPGLRARTRTPNRTP